MSDRVEARALLAILRGRWDDAERIGRSRPLDGARFVRLARECDVHPTVHAALERADRFDLLPEPARSELDDLRRKVRHDNLLLLATVERTLDVLRAAGIRPVALKGLDVLHRLYERFDERTLDDVDLLVRPDEVERALAALEGAGYRGPGAPSREHWLRSSFEMPLTSPGPVGVLVEIHWSLGQERRYTIDLDGVLARTLPFEVAGRPVSRLDPHDAVAHLLLHHVQHYFDRRLKWMLELVRTASEPGFSWQTTAERLRRWGGRRAAGDALRHVRKLFPEAVPSEALRLLPVPAWRRAVTLPLRSGHPLDRYRWTRARRVQLFLAAVLLENPAELAGYLRHRAARDRDASASAVERGGGPR